MKDHLLPDPEPMPNVLSRWEIASCIGQLVGSAALALLLALQIRPLLAQAPATESAPSPFFTCPAPVKPGQVTTITWRNDAGVISTRCQLIKDWQLLTPRGANKP